MSDILKPRRSALYMPCSNTRALEKAQTLAADVILFDLEDAVAPDAKEEARANIVKALAEKNYGPREKVLRINAVTSLWGVDDLNALKDVEFDALLLPKVESVEQINEALALLGKTMPVWLMIETPNGVQNVATIAAHPNVDVLVMGTNDLAKEMRVQQSESRIEFSYAFGACVMAARASNCDILDGVYNQLDNLEGFAKICAEGKSLGFDGKTLIHPKQLDAANTVFSPSEDEVTSAKAIIEAWQGMQQSEEAGKKGVLVVNGRLVEELHVLEAERVCALAAAIAEKQA